ncbi:MAG: hypothetical protein GQ564_07425 [Bacteroidales bacterium]|nr:hypothetical protein [Bacteroidales bacterium]
MNSLTLKGILLISILFINASPKYYNPEIWFDTQYTDAIQYCIDNKVLINLSLQIVV